MRIPWPRPNNGDAALARQTLPYIRFRYRVASHHGTVNVGWGR